MKNFIVGWLAILCLLAVVAAFGFAAWYTFSFAPEWVRWALGVFIAGSVFFGSNIHDMGQNILESRDN